MTEIILQDLFIKYPSSEISDIFKFFHQSCFGCEHLCPSRETVYERITAEYKALRIRDNELIQPLDGEYSRVSLSYIDCGLSPSTLTELFVMSSRKDKKRVQVLEHKLDAAEKLIRSGHTPINIEEFVNARREWEASGYPALHHSQAYREAYTPSYRVISNEYIPFLPLLCEIDRRLKPGTLRLAIEGGSASGKSTLGSILNEIYGCTVFHMDDYFLRPEQRTPERFAEPGGNVDRERFLEEILIPMSKGREVSYRPYNCTTGRLDGVVTAEITPLTVTEGAYSMHPDLVGYYDMSVFIDISAEKQRQRVEKRNPLMADRFFNEWIPFENKYFEAFNIKEKCDICISIK